MHSLSVAPNGEPAITVSMFGDHVVICPPAQPDTDTTRILINAAAAAVESGSIVMIDLDPTTPSAELITSGLHRDHIPTAVHKIRRVTALGAGYVRLTTRDWCWTIDLTNSRFCPSATPIDPRFVSPDQWTPIRALWATCSTVAVLKADGTYLSAQAAWTADPTSTPPSQHAQLQGTITSETAAV